MRVLHPLSLSFPCCNRVAGGNLVTTMPGDSVAKWCAELSHTWEAWRVCPLVAVALPRQLWNPAR